MKLLCILIRVFSYYGHFAGCKTFNILFYLQKRKKTRTKLKACKHTTQIIKLSKETIYPIYALKVYYSTRNHTFVLNLTSELNFGSFVTEERKFQYVLKTVLLLFKGYQKLFDGKYIMETYGNSSFLALKSKFIHVSYCTVRSFV